MIKQVLHETAGVDPAEVTLALQVALELHRPAARAPEVAQPQLMGLRTSTVRTHRRRVPLKRLDAIGA